MTMRDAIVVHSCEHLTPHLPYFDFRYVFLSIVFRVANGPKYRPIVEAYGFVAASRFQFKTAGTSGSMWTYYYRKHIETAAEWIRYSPKDVVFIAFSNT